MKSLFCEDGDHNKLCVRRMWGSVGFLAYIVGCFHPHIYTAQFATLGYLSVILLGVTTVEKFLVRKE
jgi:hypothetical protein